MEGVAEDLTNYFQVLPPLNNNTKKAFENIKRALSTHCRCRLQVNVRMKHKQTLIADRGIPNHIRHVINT